MLFKEFKEKLKGKHKQFSFISVHAVKDDYSPFYHPQYYDRHPILSSYEVFHEECWADDYIIINPHQPPLFWASGVNWNFSFNKGHLESLIIISQDDAKLLHINQHTIDFITEKCKKYLAGDKDWYDSYDSFNEVELCTNE